MAITPTAAASTTGFATRTHLPFSGEKHLKLLI
jgi:hypothetical protein